MMCSCVLLGVFVYFGLVVRIVCGVVIRMVWNVGLRFLNCGCWFCGILLFLIRLKCFIGWIRFGVILWCRIWFI